MQKTWNLAHLYVVLENKPFSKKSAFFGKNSTSTQINSVRAVLELFLVLFSISVRQKVNFYENISFVSFTSRLLQIGHQLEKNRFTSQFLDMTSSSNCFDGFFYFSCQV